MVGRIAGLERDRALGGGERLPGPVEGQLHA